MFASARRKLERAKKHLRDLESEIAEFVATKPYRFSVHSDSKTGQLGVRTRLVREPPDTLALTIGDALHNTRIALDHALYELVLADNGETKKLKFPFGRDRQAYEGFCGGCRTPSQWIKDWLVAVEAFPKGTGDLLVALNDLCNHDKHVTITPTLRALGHPPLKVLNAKGALMVEMKDNFIIGGLGDVFNVGKFPAGCSIELEENADCPANVFIRYGDEMPRPASEAIAIFLNSVEAALALAERMKPA